MSQPATVDPTPPWGTGPYSIKRHGTTLATFHSGPVHTPGCIQAHGAVLVLPDLNTRGDDGRYFLRAVRSHAALENVPVVVLSASADTRDVQSCGANGENAYHVKPVDHSLHLKVLQDIFVYWPGSVVLPA